MQNLVAFDVDPTLNRYDKKWTEDYYRRLRDRLNAAPGAVSHAFAVVPVLAGVGSFRDLETPLVGAVERLIDFVTAGAEG